MKDSGVGKRRERGGRPGGPEQSLCRHDYNLDEDEEDFVEDVLGHGPGPLKPEQNQDPICPQTFMTERYVCQARRLNKDLKI